jgi:hypothetical protein
LTDQAVTLTIPGEREYFGVAHLVLGGLASRHDLTIESFEDLLLALDGLLDRAEGTPEVTLALRVDAVRIEATVGPFAAGSLQAELDRTPDSGLGLRRLLDTVVDDFSLSVEDEGEWVRLTKTVRAGVG